MTIRSITLLATLFEVGGAGVLVAVPADRRPRLATVSGDDEPHARVLETH
jgi:hypothetical protein